MSSRFIQFSLGSLCLHFAVFWLIVYAEPFQHGLTLGTNQAVPALAVRIIAPALDQPPFSQQESMGTERSDAPQPSVEKIPELIPAPITEPVAIARRTEAVEFQDYLSTGQLTRLPAPLADIDLNVAEISDLAFTGETQITLLIDEKGVVTDIRSSTETEDARRFIERVAERFRNAQFRPGEINGKAVKSRLKIAVISEPEIDAP